MKAVTDNNMRPYNEKITGSIPSVEILGVRVHDITMEQAGALMCEMALSGMPHHIIPVNPEMVMMAQVNKEFREVLERASLNLPDGTGILLAARILGLPIRERVTGVDTVKMLAGVAARNGLSLFLLGAAPGIAGRVAEILQKENPGLKIPGTYAGSPDPSEEDEICSRIEAARPHILLVAYGAPRQELWVARTMPRLKIPITMNVGGTFDFIAGVTTRAPVWLQDAGLEWLYRLAREPHRWRRMLKLPQFGAAVLREKFLTG
jgi:N-acetylglucosaminyldiphosphoundecaprenol N-acetyl-beta-D-mannosaminyltransferase